MEHTQGQWILTRMGRDSVEISAVETDQEGNRLETPIIVGTLMAPAPEATSIGNAILMTASPRLLAACKAALAHNHLRNDDDAEWYDVVVAAIAEAEGTRKAVSLQRS